MSSKKVFVLGSPYGLFLSLLVYRITADDVFVLNGNVVSNRIVEQLRKRAIVFVRNNNAQKKSLLLKLINSICEWVRYKTFIRNNILNEVQVIGHDHILAIAYPFWGYFDTIIEDGYINSMHYQDILMLMRTSCKRYYCLLMTLYKLKTHQDYKMYGYDESVKNIYLTNKSIYIKNRKNKVKIIDIWAMWNTLDHFSQVTLQEIFSVKTLVNNLNNKKNINIIITQPLSEDGLMTEQQKIKIYTQAINDINGTIIIKPHPREITDYVTLFKDQIVLDNDIPLEIIALSLREINCVYTCFSTAANIFIGHAKIKYISVSEYPEIIKKYHLSL